MTPLNVGLSHLHEHKFNHSFQNCINPLVVVVWTLNQIITFFSTVTDDKRITLLNTLSKIDNKLIETNESSLTETLLFGNSLFDLKKDSLSLKGTLMQI